MSFGQNFLHSNTFQVQVELGHLLTLFATCGVDLPSPCWNVDGPNGCLVTINNDKFGFLSIKVDARS
jgi:hypothetical protein